MGRNGGGFFEAGHTYEVFGGPGKSVSKKIVSVLSTNIRHYLSY